MSSCGNYFISCIFSSRLDFEFEGSVSGDHSPRLLSSSSAPAFSASPISLNSLQSYFTRLSEFANRKSIFNHLERLYNLRISLRTCLTRATRCTTLHNTIATLDLLCLQKIRTRNGGNLISFGFFFFLFY